jgi:hypothetical protein
MQCELTEALAVLKKAQLLDSALVEAAKVGVPAVPLQAFCLASYARVRIHDSSPHLP